MSDDSEERRTRIVRSEWITGTGCVGFLLVQTRTGKYRCYVGPVFGFDQRGDELFLQDWGSRFPNAWAQPIFPEIPAEEWDRT